MSASLSGKHRRFGRQALDGARLWTEQTSQRGGLLLSEGAASCPLHLYFYDDGSDAEGAAAATRRLLSEDRVDLLLGPYSSGLTLAAARVAEQFQRVLWNHGGAADTIYEQGFAWTVGILSPASRYFVGALDLVRSLDPTARRVALVGAVGSEFASAVLAGVEARAAETGFEVVLRGDHGASGSGLNDFLQSVRRCRPDLVLVAGSFEQDVNLAQALRTVNHDAHAIGLVAAGVDEFGQRLGGQAAGYLGPSQWEPAPAERPEVGPSAAEVAGLLRGREGRRADYPAAQAYAAGLVMQHCVEVAGTLDPLRLREIAGALDFSTFYGRFRIDPVTGRQVGHEVLIVQWQGMSKRVVWPPRVAETAARYPVGGSGEQRW